MDEIILQNTKHGTIVRRRLGEAGLSYLRERLAEGNTLSRLTLAAMDLDQGEAYVYIPEHISMKLTLKFELGGKLTPDPGWRNEKHGVYIEELPQCDPPIEAEVNHHLEKSRRNVCLLEDIDMRSSDSFCKILKKENYIFMEKDVYLFLLHKHAKTQRIMETISLPPAFGILNSFLTSFPPDAKPKLKKFTFMSEDILHQFAARTEKIFTSAYDGESFVFWEKNV